MRKLLMTFCFLVPALAFGQCGGEMRTFTTTCSCTGSDWQTWACSGEFGQCQVLLSGDLCGTNGGISCYVGSAQDHCGPQGKLEPPLKTKTVRWAALVPTCGNVPFPASSAARQQRPLFREPPVVLR